MDMVDILMAKQLAGGSGGGGGGGDVLVVGAEMSGSTLTLNKTWREIFDATFAVWVDVGEDSKSVLPIYGVVPDPYQVQVLNPEGSSFIFVADSPDGYPSANMG